MQVELLVVLAELDLTHILPGLLQQQQEFLDIMLAEAADVVMEGQLVVQVAEVEALMVEILVIGVEMQLQVQVLAEAAVQVHMVRVEMVQAE